MILDRLANIGKYTNLHPGFAKAFEFLKAAQISPPGVGRHEIDGNNVYAIVAASVCRGREEAKLEAHRKYIDIQLTTAGEDVYGWNSLESCINEAQPFSETDDIGFFEDASESWVSAPVGTFVVFFPEDAHAPLCGIDVVEKIIVKVAVTTLGE